ncbi:MAG: DUF2207 domain-containing protein [Anaerovoracaceae bacterium]|jgi:uncharacterized membrane protein YgcG
MLTKKYRRTAVLILAAVLCALLTVTAAADTAFAYEIDTNMETPRMDVQIKSHSDNSYTYTERIRVKFLTARHGIYRYIPLSKDYAIRDIHVPNAEYSLSTVDGNRVIKIGDPDRTITGYKTYTIRYTIAFFKDKNKNGDTMHLDVIPSSWKTTIQNAHVHIIFPKNADLSRSNIKTYSGSYGSTADEYGTWTFDKTNGTADYHATDLPNHTGVTLLLKLPEGFWKDVPMANRWTMWLFAAVAIASLVAMFILRRRAGNGAPVVETVEFYPPEGLTSATIGYIIDGDISEQDVTSLLLELAGKGYLRIEEKEKPTEEGETNFSFVKLKPLSGTERPYLKMYYEALFGTDPEAVPIGKKVTLKSLKKKLGKSYDKISQAIEKEFSTGDRAIFSPKSSKAQKVILCIYAGAAFVLSTAFLIYTGLISENWLTMLCVSMTAAALAYGLLASVRHSIEYRRSKRAGSAGAVMVISIAAYLAMTVAYTLIVRHWLGLPEILATAVFLLVSPFLVTGIRKWTPWGAEIYGKVVGFRNFIERAEADQLRMLLKDDPNYFNETVPYAYAFGLLKKWAGRFSEILDEDDSDAILTTNFGTAAGLSVLSSSISTIASEIGTEVHESSSSFSGGDGGSGGGGGGGGGGSW